MVPSFQVHPSLQWSTINDGKLITSQGRSFHWTVAQIERQFIFSFFWAKIGHPEASIYHHSLFTSSSCRCFTTCLPTPHSLHLAWHQISSWVSLGPLLSFLSATGQIPVSYLWSWLSHWGHFFSVGWISYSRQDLNCLCWIFSSSAKFQVLPQLFWIKKHGQNHLEDLLEIWMSCPIFRLSP